MSAETSNAPRELWAVIDPGALGEDSANADGILPSGMVEHSTDEGRARSRAQYRDRALNRTRPKRKHLTVGYVRRDLVVPTVDDLRAKVGELLIDERFGAVIGDDLHEWLLSRIEGDHDEA
jgi:hypothetical protein